MPDILERTNKHSSPNSIDNKENEVSINSESSNDSESNESSEVSSAERIESFNKLDNSDSSSSMEIIESFNELNVIYYMTNMKKFNKPNCKSNYFKELYCEHLLQSFKALNFCKILSPVEEEALAKRKVVLPKKDTHLSKINMNIEEFFIFIFR